MNKKQLLKKLIKEAIREVVKENYSEENYTNDDLIKLANQSQYPWEDSDEKPNIDSLTDITFRWDGYISKEIGYGNSVVIYFDLKTFKFNISYIAKDAFHDYFQDIWSALDVDVDEDGDKHLNPDGWSLSNKIKTLLENGFKRHEIFSPNEENKSYTLEEINKLFNFNIDVDEFDHYISIIGPKIKSGTYFRF